MAVGQEIWEKDIEKILYSNQAFLTNFKDESAFIGGTSFKTLHIPQAGVGGAIQKGGAFSTNELAVTERVDTDISLTLETYRILPISLGWSLDDYLVSYDKRMSLFEDAYAKLAATIGDDALFAIANGLGAGSIISTTGAASNSALGISATGTRNKLTAQDIISAAILLDTQDVPSEDRYAVVDAKMYGQLLSDPSVSNYAGFSVATMPSGFVPEIGGIKILKRSKVTQYATGGTLKDYNSSFTGAATDNMGAVIFQKSAVLKAMGPLNIFQTNGSATRQADIISFNRNFVSGRRRSDNKGVVVIRQA